MSATQRAFGSLGDEDAIDQVRGRGPHRIGFSRASEAASVGPLEPRLAHQARDPLSAVTQAVCGKLGVDAGGAVGAAAHLVNGAKPLEQILVLAPARRRRP